MLVQLKNEQKERVGHVIKYLRYVSRLHPDLNYSFWFDTKLEIVMGVSLLVYI